MLLCVHVEAPHQASSPWELPQSILCPWESLPNNNSSLEMLKTIPTEYLNRPPENKHMVFRVFLSHLLSGGLESHPGAFVSIKPGLFLIYFDLVWFRLLHHRRGLSGCRNFSSGSSIEGLFLPLAWGHVVGKHPPSPHLLSARLRLASTKSVVLSKSLP